MNTSTCPHCGVEHFQGAGYLGLLGDLDHYRCTHCGGNWSEYREEFPEADSYEFPEDYQWEEW